MYKMFLAAIFSFGVISTTGVSQCEAQLEDPLIQALAGYHFTATTSELESIAGGEDALVARLLELRSAEKPPFVGIRSAKLLLNYGHRSEVKTALVGDMEAVSRLGIARTLVAHIDSASEPSLRHSLAEAAVRRAGSEEKFKLYARELLKSSDEQVRRLAKEMQ